jgi:hypothetical protein
MKDMERQKFEGEWKEAFGKAEVSPSENLWTNIELDLAKAEGEEMKRRLFFYKLMAAASIAFAMCVAGVGTYMYKNPSAEYIAANTVSTGNSYSNGSSEAQPLNGISQTLSNQTLDSDNDIAQKDGSGEDANQDHAYVYKNPKGSSDVNKENIATVDNSTDKSIRFSDENNLTSNASITRLNDSENANSVLRSNEKSFDKNGAAVTANNAITTDNDGEENAVISKPSLTALLESQKVKYESQQTEVDPFLAMMARLEQRELELREDKKTDKKKKKSKFLNENLWTSLGFAAGSFSSASSNVNSLEASLDQQPSNSLSAARNNTADASKDVAAKQSKASGTSYSLGLSIGTKVSERWVVHGGVNYLSQNSSYETTAISRDGESNFNLFTIKEAAQSSDPNVTSTAPYNVNSNLQFVSVPIQAGYMALKRKVGIQINTGVSTELFLQSVASAVVNNESKSVKDGWGSESPYRTVNFSGLFGTEFSYRFGDHYRVALNPGLRYPFSSLYKSEIGVKSIPLTVDVGVKLRYIFH